MNLKTTFGRQYNVKLSEEFELERPELRDEIEWYYIIPAKHGHFYLHGKNTIAFCCTANRIKEPILREFEGKVTLFLECEDESILLFDKSIFAEIASIARAKRRQGRKTLSTTEKRQLVGAGKRHQFTGKSPQHTEPAKEISLTHDSKVVA